MPDFDYPAFLAARLDEMEHAFSGPLRLSIPATHEYVLADIAAKRAILEDNRELRKRLDNSTDLACPHFLGRFTQSAHDVKTLCRPFAAHPEYRGERADG